MNTSAYALIGLTVIVAALASTLTFAVLRLAAAARGMRKGLRPSENGMLAAALEQSVVRLKAQELVTAARADASERLNGEIISSLTAGLIVVDVNGEVRIINPAGHRLLNLGGGDTSKDYRELIGEPALSMVITECLSNGVPIVRRTVHIPERPDRAASRFGVTVSPLLQKTGELQGVACLFTDLTSVQLLEEQLRLKESLATVGELTAGIAHEFRNGLATIHGYGKLIDPKLLPEAYRPYVAGIRAETTALGEVVTNFLNFARPAQLTLTDVDLRAVCERAAEEVRGEARGLGGDVTVRGTFGRLQGDEVLLRQAFSNLLRNAVEACAEASVVPVVVIESRIDPVQGGSRVAIDDNGPGIDLAFRERVFQPFFTSRRKGIGLGLALVQKIIVFHNGRVTAGISPLGGASLQVSLPTS